MRFNQVFAGQSRAGACLEVRVAVDAADNVAVIGPQDSATIYDVFVALLDADGAEQWTATFAGPFAQTDNAGDITFDPDGNVLVTGALASAAMTSSYWVEKLSSDDGGTRSAGRPRAGPQPKTAVDRRRKLSRRATTFGHSSSVTDCVGAAVPRDGVRAITLDPPSSVKPRWLNASAIGVTGQFKLDTGAIVTDDGVASSTARNVIAVSAYTLWLSVLSQFLPPTPADSRRTRVGPASDPWSVDPQSDATSMTPRSRPWPCRG